MFLFRKQKNKEKIRNSENLQIFSKYFVILNSFTNFAPLEPAKPLYNAQIGGSVFLYTL